MYCNCITQSQSVKMIGSVTIGRGTQLINCRVLYEILYFQKAIKNSVPTSEKTHFNSAKILDS
jgi:hypothetical protein